MANDEQLAILKQGVAVWNQWREDHPDIQVDLSEAVLNGADLEEVNLSKANLRGALFLQCDCEMANLIEADLSKAHLSHTRLSKADLSNASLCGSEAIYADFYRANLKGVDLSKSYLSHAQFTEAHLTQANVSSADLGHTDLSFTDLTEANLFYAVLAQANLNGAHVIRTDFSTARVGGTVFGKLDLSQCIGLETVGHLAPSIIGTSALATSKGKIPEVFLRGCGLSDWEIESTKLYDPDLSNKEVNQILYSLYDQRASQALQISPLFISYSHADGEFVDKLETSLDQRGIRFWRDIHDLKAGRMDTQIDRALRLNPTVLLVLSKHSLQSDWVEHEAREARRLEKELGRDVLCPVALDDSWKKSSWSQRLMEQVLEYNILDFSNWQDDSQFESTFNKLIDGLELFYKR